MCASNRNIIFLINFNKSSLGVTSSARIMRLLLLLELFSILLRKEVLFIAFDKWMVTSQPNQFEVNIAMLIYLI